MTKYILHGGFTRKDNELNRSFYRELLHDVPQDGTVLLVFFASRDEDNSVRSVEVQRRLQEQAEGKKLNFVVATEEDFPAQLKQCDAVYLNGGSTLKLLSVLKRYPNFVSLIKNKTVAGSSAGAYVFSTYYASHWEGALKGLGILPLRVICHSESPELPPTPQAVGELKNMTHDLELVILKDCEWKVFRFD